MAKETNDITELDDKAFELYAQRMAVLPARQGEYEAMQAYKQAEAFFAVRAKIHSGELETAEPEGPQLADCCCPNLARTHPYNLVARLHTDRKGVQTPGDPVKVNRILKWLDKNPTPEKDPDQLVVRINREFPELGWELPQIDLARDIFPAYTN